MQHAIVVKGRLISPTRIELEEPVSGVGGNVEVFLRTVSARTPEQEEGILDFLRGLQPGTRSKADVDRQIQEERESGGER